MSSSAEPQHQRINYRVAIADADLGAKFGGVLGLPTSFVLDRQGRVAQRHIGLVSPAVYEQEVRALAGLPVAATRDDTRAANVRLILDRIVGMDAERRCVACSSREHLDYDLLSLDIGGETDQSWLQTLGDRLIAVRPFHLFVPQWQETIQAAQTVPGFRLVVVGGGAGGVEIALAARHAFVTKGLDASVDLAASEAGVLSEHAPSVSKRIRRLAARFGVRIHDERAVGAGDGVLLSNGERLLADRAVAASGVRPACWLQLSKMSLDQDGYIIVDSAHRSVSHSEVFAAGDVCSRQDVKMERSGVHAVHAGAILAHNVVAVLAGRSMRGYLPRRRRTWDGVQAVESLADNSMALLARPVTIDLERTPVLCWLWRVDGVVRSADMKRRSGDDYAARVYVAFSLRPESIGFMTRMALRAARKPYGDLVPDAAINYVWDNRYPEGTASPNAYTDRTRMIVAQTGDTKIQQWVWERRDVVADFGEHFGLPDPQISSIAVATDTDNTHSKARAGFADIGFVPRGMDCASLIAGGA